MNDVDEQREMIIKKLKQECRTEKDIKIFENKAAKHIDHFLDTSLGKRLSAAFKKDNPDEREKEERLKCMNELMTSLKSTEWWDDLNDD